MTQNWGKGDLIDDRYEVYNVVEGGMGLVYICYDNENKEPCVLKTIRQEFSLSPEGKKLFEREALLWIELERHPYIVRAQYVENIKNRLFIVLEYIAPDNQGRNTLTHYLGSLSLVEILDLAIQFCYGMEYAYSKGIKVHRDIKPDNIMITQGKTVKITDFGLAKAFDKLELRETMSSESEYSGLGIFQTQGGRAAGTPEFMAPEQFDGFADMRSDIYAFGVVLYVMASGGKLPFFCRPRSEYKNSHMFAEIPKLDSPLYPIITSCMEKKPEARLRDFDLLRQKLEVLFYRETSNIFYPDFVFDFQAWEWMNKGFALGNLGRYEEAINCCDEAIRLEPGNALAWCNKGSFLENLCLHQEALKCTDEAIRVNPEYANAWNNKGKILGNLGRHEEAIKCYDEAIRLNPQYALAWNNKGVALCRLNRNEEAIKCYDEAIRLNPQYALAWSNKGAALENLGRNEEAIKCYDEAISIDPKYDKVWYNKGFALMKLDRYEESIRCFDEAIQINPSFTDAFNNKGFILRKIGRYEEAVKWCDEAIKINPQYANAWFNKGYALYHLGGLNEALNCAEQALKINPNLEGAQELCARCVQKGEGLK